MTGFDELIRLLSIPRPNGSPAERETSRQLQEWLKQRRIPFEIHTFRHYPYFFECLGLWMILSRSLLVLAVWLRWGWAALPIAIIGLLGGTLDHALHLPLVSWPGARRGENLIIQFNPQAPEQELILSAHYDSKTELLDHRQRMFLLKSVPGGLVISLVLGFLGPLDAWLLHSGSSWASFTYTLGFLMGVPLLVLAWAFGLNLTLGRLLAPSQGTIDNGAACAILCGLAERVQAHRTGRQVDLELEDAIARTRLTLAIFSGEEVNLQGSRAYARQRSAQPGGWDLPTANVNMEAMAQDGDYVVWDLDGSIYRMHPTHPDVNQGLRQAVTAVTGCEPVSGGPIISDGASFMAAGIPHGELGTYHTRWADTGFHRPTDNPSRLVMDRLPEGVQILRQLLKSFHRGRFTEI